MKPDNTETVKGFSDFLGEEALKRERIRGVLVKNFELYGFEPAETPIVEFEDFVRGENEYDEAVSDIFKLEDKGKRKLALRYELTFSLKRIMKNKKLPYKRYQIGPVFRDEPVSANRLRQFTQSDIDIVSSNIKEEAEILACAMAVCKELGIKAEIQINSRKLSNAVIKSLGIDNVEFVLREIDKLDKQGEDAVKLNMSKFISKDRVIQLFKMLNWGLPSFKKYEGYKELAELISLLEEYGIKPIFKPSLARGLSYYNGTVFEIKMEGMKETVAAGGAYMFNNVQCCGISFGIERLMQLAKVKLKKMGVLIVSIGQDKKAVALSQKLRKENVSCVIFDKLMKGLEYADAYAIPFAIFIGKEEVKKKKVKLRDMKSGNEEMLTEKQLVEKLRKQNE